MKATLPEENQLSQSQGLRTADEFVTLVGFLQNAVRTFFQCHWCGSFNVCTLVPHVTFIFVVVVVVLQIPSKGIAL